MRKIKLLVVWGVIALGIGTYLFLNEAQEWLKDGYTELISGVTIPATKEETSLITGFVLEPEVNNARLIQVNNLTFEGRNNRQVSIAFELVNMGASNDYPSLKVVCFDQNHQAVSNIVFSNSDYTHGMKFGSELVKLTFELPAGVTSVEVIPFYLKQGKTS
jgi:hypothetical protein